MKTLMRYFSGSFLFTLVAIILAYIIAGSVGAFTAAILGVLETSLSFDNAVVNATVLKDMDHQWRRRFLTWGILVAVFGMRVVFPLLIVSVVANISPYAALMMAVQTPQLYADTLSSAHISIAAFGGAFLLMVFFKFFLDAEKDVHWIAVIEHPLTRLGKIEAVEIALTLLSLYAMSKILPSEEALPFMISGIMGVVTYVFSDGLGALLETDEEAEGVNRVVKSGIASFMYLELLDASFSFDGVIGAFALTNSIFLIALGLGIGAVFVRSLTLMLVDKGTLETFRYLEHGAFYAIGSLAAIMFIGTVHEIPEVVTGLIGATFIGIALLSSVLYTRTQNKLQGT
ncbi:MAG: DUF475 domain-containing protein [Gammaproteobacteria bacterium]